MTPVLPGVKNAIVLLRLAFAKSSYYAKKTQDFKACFGDMRPFQTTAAGLNSVCLRQGFLPDVRRNSPCLSAPDLIYVGL